MKKWAGVLLAASLTLAGCSAGTSGSPGSGQKEKISFIHWRGEDTKVFNELISQFEKENPKIDVEMNVFPSDQYQTLAQTKLMDGTVGDVFASFPGAQFQSIAKANLYADLTDSKAVKNYQPEYIKAGQKDGKQLAVPYQLVYNMPLYNEEIFKKYGLTPPKNWDDFLAAVMTLKKNGLTPIAFPGADIGPGQFMNTMVMNNAPDDAAITNLEKGKSKLTEEWWVKTLTQFKELKDAGAFQDNELGTKSDAAAALFAQGKAAMLATGTYSISTVKSINPNIKLQLLAPITVPENQAKWEGIHTTTFMLGINSRSQHKEAAEKFLEFLSDPKHASDYANKTVQHVTVKDVTYSSEDLKKTAEWSNKKTRFQPRFLIQNMDVQTAAVNSIQDVLSGTDPKEAAAKAQKIVDQALAK
ncbi:extracellular solute-binding protein [Metabacillus sp. GX 13764]|uniref:ABC transporter substrate-binding protein n=1 Tax=Metabacillus kandeliae TaxID=2900151 RepID=UPI001E4758F3|nr:extracellular solute-binding protein [Metabacillus kandeliae]MCD7034634.1 extracellular solute-binding protein [Metabacillus kandeliae]